MSGGVPYLGSKISLISKSEIRYEGILYTIDTKESTVALAKVRSLGTEGRPTDRPVAPRDEIYEYIIFRASDIKDLHVCEPPKSQSSLSGLPNDPAIVQHSSPITTSYTIPYGQHSFGHVCSLPPFQHYQPAFQHIPQTFFSAGHLQRSLRKSPTIDAAVQVSVGNFESEDETSQAKLKPRPRDINPVISNVQLQQQTLPATRRLPQRGRGLPRRGRGRSRRGSVTRAPEILRFDCEYDFEQANAEFQELESKLAKTKLDDSGTETLAGGDNEEEEIVGYNREKSFFDNISCEASRQSKGLPRFDWKVERKLNVETFGVPSSNNWFRRRRGRGGMRRGFRGRGGNIGTTKRETSDMPKTVTFQDDNVAEKEISVENEEPQKEVPIVEVTISKENDWEEPSEKKEQWN